MKRVLLATNSNRRIDKIGCNFYRKSYQYLLRHIGLPRVVYRWCLWARSKL